MEFEINLHQLTEGKIRGDIDIKTINNINGFDCFLELKLKAINKVDLRLFNQISRQINYINNYYNDWYYLFIWFDAEKNQLESLFLNNRALKELCKVIN